MCPVKSPSAQSSNPSTPHSKYASRPSLAIQQRQQQQRQELQPQLSPEALARHGIKVRDFAYESNLPSIPSIPRVRQLSLAARPLKRTKRQNEQSDVFAIDASQSDAANPFRASLLELDHDHRGRSKPLERKSTEPAIIPERQRQHPFRDVGYIDLSQHASSSQAVQKSPLNTPTPVTPTPNRIRTSSPTTLPFPFPTTFPGLAGESQGTEPSIDTPLATPKGSLTWPTVTSDVPASQLDGDSQPPAAEDTTYSQLGFSAPSSQTLDSNLNSGGRGPLSPNSPRPTEPASTPPQPPPRRLNGARASSPLSPSLRNHAIRSPTDPEAQTPSQDTVATTAPRYFLRKHGAPAQASASPASPNRKRVSSSSKMAARYPGKAPAVTRQAAHAAVSGSGGRSSHARPLRKTTLP